LLTSEQKAPLCLNRLHLVLQNPAQTLKAAEEKESTKTPKKEHRSRLVIATKANQQQVQIIFSQDGNALSERTSTTSDG